MQCAIFFAILFFLIPFLFPYLRPLDIAWHRWVKQSRKICPLEVEIQTISYLVGGLRAGIDLQESLTNNHSLSAPVRNRLRQIGQSNQSKSLDFIISAALKNGGSCLISLQRLKQSTRRMQQMKKKILAASAQARAQAYTLILLSPTLFLAMAFLNPELIPPALSSPLSIFMLIISALLLFAGWKWLKYLMEKSTSLPAIEQLSLEQLPKYIEDFLGRISSGHDIQSTEEALEKNFRFQLNGENISFSQLSHSKHCPDIIHQLERLCVRSKQFGSPIRQELQEILDDLFFTYETTLEANIQKLPVKLLAPLFICALPAVVLNIAALILPLIFSSNL